MNLEHLRNNKKTEDFDFALMFGGKGFEREVSLFGAYRFLKEARRIGLSVLPIFIDPVGDFHVFVGDPEQIPNISRETSFDLLIPAFPMKIGEKSGFLKANGELISVRLVFPLLHGDFGEDGVIQGLLSALGIEFFGADNFTGAVAADKVYSKLVASSAGVPTLPHLVVSSENLDAEKLASDIEESFGFPAFVKPVRLGSSVGASLVKSKELFANSLKKALSVSDRIMIEPALIDKRELECAYYNVGGRKIITPPAEISVSSGFYDYNSKYKDLSAVKLTPKADVKSDIREKIISYTDSLAESLSVRHIARFDYFLTPDGSVYFNEVNTMPGMTETSLYSAMLDMAGLSFADFILSVKEIGS